MKKLIVVVAALLLSVGAYAQGSLQMNNRIVGTVDAPVTIAAGSVGAGNGAGSVNALVQLFQVNGTALTPLGTAISFRGPSGALASYFSGPDVDVPAGPTNFRVRVWTGASFDAAKTSGGYFGESTDFTAVLGGGLLPAGTMDNLKSFTIQAVPEPTTIALGVLGAAALIAARRRK